MSFVPSVVISGIIMAICRGNQSFKSLLNNLSPSLAFTDYLDVFMPHQVDEEILGTEEIANVFLKLKRTANQGTGVSTYTLEETEKPLNLILTLFSRHSTC